MTYGVFAIVVLGGLFWLAYRRPRPRRWLLPRPARRAVATSAVSRQHQHLADGGLIGTSSYEETKARLVDLLAAGRADEVAENLQPGLQFAVQVRALAEIGTAEAGRVLARQLERDLSSDPVEQSWYWIDVVSGLRRLNHADALPAILRCADAAGDLPHGAVLSAEAVAFPNFATALTDLKSPPGRSALKVLARTVRAARSGLLEPVAVVRSQVAESLAQLCENAPPTADPWVTAALAEAERLYRRLGSWTRLLPDDARSAAERQAVRLWSSAQRRRRWLSEAPRRLILRFASTSVDEQRAILDCLRELKADASLLFPGLPDRRAVWWAEAIRCLAWSRAETTGPILAGLAGSLLAGRRTSTAAEVALSALRGHRCETGEAVLLRAARSAEPNLRRTAVAALGWQDPIRTAAVVACLNGARHDADNATREAAGAALARLGERAALREFTERLTSEELSIRLSAIRAIAEEGISWLWPDVDVLVDSVEPDVSAAAAETVAQLYESAFGLA